jgi:hypothetical protein
MRDSVTSLMNHDIPGVVDARFRGHDGREGPPVNDYDPLRDYLKKQTLP